MGPRSLTSSSTGSGVHQSACAEERSGARRWARSARESARGGPDGCAGGGLAPPPSVGCGCVAGAIGSLPREKGRPPARRRRPPDRLLRVVAFLVLEEDELAPERCRVELHRDRRGG